VLNRSYLLAVLASFLFFLAVSAFTLMPRQLVGLGASSTEVGWIMGAMQVATALATPFVGLYLHRFGARGFMIRGAVLFAAACLCLSMTPGLGWLLYAARIVQGLAFAMFFVAAGALVVSVLPARQRAQGIAAWGAGVLAPFAVAPPLGEQLLRTHTFAELYMATGCCCAGAALVSLFLRALPTDQARPTSLVRLLRVPAIAGGIAVLFALAMVFGTLLSFLSAFTEREDLGPVWPFFVAYTSASLVIRLSAGRLADRVDRRVVIIPSFIVASWAIAGLALATSSVHLAVLGAVYGLGTGFSSPALMAFVLDHAEHVDQPRVVALENWAMTLGILAAAVIVGPLADWAGMRFAFVAIAVVGTTAALSLMPLRPNRVRSP
jgi:MFS family permease